MTIYKKAYFLLFNAITDALEQLAQERSAQAQQTLIAAQQNALCLFFLFFLCIIYFYMLCR